MKNKRAKILLAGLIIFAVSIAALAQSNYIKVRFGKGRTSAVLKGSLKNSNAVKHYELAARGGQTMTVHVSSAKKNAKFSVYPYGQTYTLDGAEGVDDWSGELPENGRYVITVMSDGGASNYTLEVGIR